MRPIVINDFLHSARILADGCDKFRAFSVEGTELDREQIAELVDRSLMLVTALSPVIGYDKASAIAHSALDEGTSLKEAALKTGWLDEPTFDAAVNPRKMARPSGLVSRPCRPARRALLAALCRMVVVCRVSRWARGRANDDLARSHHARLFIVRDDERLDTLHPLAGSVRALRVVGTGSLRRQRQRHSRH